MTPVHSRQGVGEAVERLRPGQKSVLHGELAILFRDARGGVVVTKRDREMASLAEGIARTALSTYRQTKEDTA